MARKVDLGVTKLLWVPGDTGIADESAPTVEELTAQGVLDLSCLMVTTYEVRPDTSDTTQERAVCQTANVSTPTIRNYQGNLVLFRDWDDDQQAFTMQDVLNTFVHGHMGWFVRRLGLPYTAAVADGQQVETFKFMSDTPQTPGGTGEGFLKATIPLHQQGQMDVRAIVGGAES